MTDQFGREGFPAGQVAFTTDVDVRFLGQASEIRLTMPAGPVTDRSLRVLAEEFEKEHERLYGHRSDPDNPVEIVAIRLIGRAGAYTGKSHLRPAERLDGQAQSSRPAYFGEKWGVVDTPVISRRQLDKPAIGPFLIDEYDSTTVVAPGMKVWRDEFENLVIEPQPV